jgi:hypothetical protein
VKPYAQFTQPQQSVAIIEDMLQGICKILQPSKPMLLNWEREMQTLLMSLDAFT